MNKIVMIGRLTRDPEVRYTQGENSSATARYTLAVDRRFKGRDGQYAADFIPCVAFGKSAEFAEKYLKKGMKMAVSGHLQTGSYEKDGVKHYTTDVIIEDQEFCESKREAGSGQQASGSSSGGEWQQADGFMDIPDGIDEELPFN